MSKIDEILAEAGFPNTPEGRAAFYNEFPTKEDWENYKEMKKGGSLSGAPHNGQPTADEFFSFGDPTFGNLNIPFGNFAYGGYYGPGGTNNPSSPMLKEEPRGATKVTTVDPGYSMLGTIGSKTFYDKKADKAIASPGSGSGVSDQWKQSMISRLQSGVSPQSLVEAGHISKDAAKDFEQYYKPVYTEATKPATPASSPQSMPLKDQDRIDRKWISSPGNQSQYYDSYMYPDVNSGYTNPTRRYFDKKTGQEIDPAKSFSDKGDYVASFIQGAPGAEGTLKQTRINTPIGSASNNPVEVALSSGFAYGGDVASPTNYGAFPNTEYGGILNQDNNQDYPVFEDGGNEFEKGGSFYSLINNLKKQKKKLYKSGGDTVMQGGNSTDYPSKIRSEFDNAIKANTYNAFVDEQGDEMLEQFKQMGGPQLNPQNQAYQQMLQQSINQGQSGLNQAANNLYGATMDVFNTMGTKDKTKVKEVKARTGGTLPKAQDGFVQPKEGETYSQWAQNNKIPGGGFNGAALSNHVWNGTTWVEGDKKEGYETTKKESLVKRVDDDKKAAEREKLLDQIISQYQESQKQPKRDYYPYGYDPQQYGYPAHQYNYGYGMGYFPMNYGYKHSISSSDVEALKQLAKNPSSNLREFSHRKFGPWSKTKMTFGYKDQLPEITPSGNVSYIPEPSRGFTEGFPAVHTVEGKPVEKGFQEYATNQETGPRADNQYQNMVEVDPLQRFIPKQIMMDKELGKKYGGLLKAQAGKQTPISFPNWGNTSFGQTPQFSTPESVGYSKPVQSQSVAQTFGNTLSDKTTSFRSDVGPEKQVEITQKTKPKFNQEAMANWEIAGANMLASGLEQRDVAANQRKLKQSQLADNAMIATPENATSRGDYDPNSGMLRPDNYVPVQFYGQSVAAYGGFMQDGGVPQQDSREQQIMQGVAQMLQQGAESEDVLKQLVEMGLAEDQAAQIIDTVINQLQMSEQEQPMMSPMQPPMQYGGYNEGEEYDLSPEEMEYLKNQGYDFDILEDIN